MQMKYRICVVFAFLLVTTVSISSGCQIEGINNWIFPQNVNILDTFRGSVIRGQALNIEALTGVSYNEGLNGGPYLQVTFQNSIFEITTNDAYPDYEEYETEQTMGLTVNFMCSNGNPASLIFLVRVEDTNNNPPRFLLTNDPTFKILPPLPPGYSITGCNDDVTVRDIDLTTQRIDFAIEDNPYFEIVYYSSTVPKEFQFMLRTKTFVRTFPEPLTIWISATDVDQTQDPPITTNTTIRIEADSDFEIPEELLFTQTFYLANYTEDHTLISDDTIALRQGFDNQVAFSLDGEYAEYFVLTQNGNQVSLGTRTQLPDVILLQNKILLIVNAAREYTSGASATIIVYIPEVIPIEFEKPHYEGTVEDNNLELENLNVNINESFSITITGDHASFFNPIIQGNAITLTMAPLSQVIIANNNILSLQVIAANNQNSALTVITLEIIKDDNITPVFEKALYMGTYENTTGLALEDIILVQGYDESVDMFLEGEHADFFQLIDYRPVFRLTSLMLPSEILQEQQLLLTVVANKPRSVNTTAVISITLPAARELGFERSSYTGTIQNNSLTLDSVRLNIGYSEDVRFVITGEYASFFAVSNIGNEVTINIAATQIPESVILDNNFLLLTLTATGQNAVSISTTILLEVIKNDATTPVFGQNIYYGHYGASDIDIQNINLAQGYDPSVTFRLDGEHSQYFGLTVSQNDIILTLQSSIPEDLIFNEKVFVFNLLAEKPLTVGANTAIVISFTEDMIERAVMTFSQNVYVGSFENSLTLNNIILDTGFTSDTQFFLTGEHASYFGFNNTSNVVTLSIINDIPREILEEKTFIVLELEARRERAISVSTGIIIDIIKEDIVIPVFSAAHYAGVYSQEHGFQFNQTISLIEGYDESVTFTLIGEFSNLFTLNQNGNSPLLVAISTGIPDAVLENNNHLILNVIAQKLGTIDATAAIFIDLPKDIVDPVVLNFEQNSYIGRIENGELEIQQLVILGDIQESLTLNVMSNQSSYFRTVLNNNIVTLELSSELPEEVTEEYKFIILDIEVSHLNAVSGYATIIIEIIKETEPEIIPPVFEQAYYIGEYTEENVLLFENTIQLIQGLDETVSFTLVGDDSRWFDIIYYGESNLTITVADDGFQELPERSQLVYSIVASKPDSLPGKTAIIISLKDMLTDRSIQFSQNSYRGTLNGSNLELEIITINAAYSDNYNYSLKGDYSEYFQLTHRDGNFTIFLTTDLPNEALETNNLLVFTLQAQTPNTEATTTIILEIIKENAEAPILQFERIYYTGDYSEFTGLNFETQISLTERIDESITFSLEGDDSEWFNISHSGDYVTIINQVSIPSAILANNLQLIFVIAAQRTGSAPTRATIVIALRDEYTETTILGFDRVSYFGNLEQDIVSLPPITVTEGYTQNVSFSLHGDLAQYFSLTSVGPTVSISLANSIPEQSIPTNGIIIFEIRASATQFVPAYATIILQVVRDDDDITPDQLLFNQTFYTGHYTEASGLVFEEVITLDQGYDDSVEFTLEGENSQWFSLVRSSTGTVTIVLETLIPAAVLANNQKLIFVIAAQRTGSAPTRATIVIALRDEYTETTILGFDRVSYFGNLEQDIVSLPPITVTEGYTQNVSFSLHGDLAQYFSLTSVGPTVSISLANSIPEQSIPTNGIIILEIRASATQVVPAYATIILQVVRDDDDLTADQLLFNQTFYTGHYTEASGLVFEEVITLDQGYDNSVEFTLEGENSQWFSLVRSSTGTVIIVLETLIPAAVLANNQKLIFVIAAQRTGSAPTRATIVIALRDEYTETTILGFDRVSYFGNLEQDIVSLPPITVTEGYTQNVSFSLHGDLAQYFSLTSVGPTVSISLANSIPEQSIPTNGIIIFEIRASATQVVPAYATIILQVVRDDDDITPDQLLFNQTFYTGHYTEASGLVFEEVITLDQGYDNSVEFTLEGENSQWFSLVRSSTGTVTIVLETLIPAAVLANNQKLIFVIAAQRTGSAPTRATIVIALRDEYTETTILGFERVSYFGNLEQDIVSLPPITVTEGYTQNVSFSLHGDLAQYFSLTSVGPTVSISLANSIPEQSIPTNGIIIFEIRASATQVVPAYATIILQVVRDDDDITPDQLLFNQTFYTGHYTEASGLVFEEVITLDQGYDDSVEFTLEGENSQWFSLVQSSTGTVTIVLETLIPAAVLANNQKLIFVIAAQRTGSAPARATIVIALRDEYTETTILGFDRVSYFGNLEQDIVSLPPITVTEGYTQNVSFSLHGDLAQYFSLTSVGPTVSISLANSIPEQSIPANGIIIFEIRASATQFVPAYATIILQVVRDDDDITPDQLLFNQTFYTGHYTEASGLVFEEVITLDQGYDDSVEFTLEGENSQWFSLVRSSTGTVTIVLETLIPAAVLANNQKLIFVIAAQRTGSAPTRATIVIALRDEYTETTILGFDRVSYFGNLEQDIVSLPPITVTEGYTQNVSFSLHGDLAQYFSLTSVGPTVSISLANSIPEQSIPTNGIIILEIRASATQVVPAYATIILQVVRDDDDLTADQLLFNQTFYTGHYTEASGLVFEEVITLDQGYDNSVEFTLEGENSQWFSLVRSSTGTVTIVLETLIPAAVLAYNQKLIFVIAAQRTGSAPTRATIVIALRDEYTETTILGFDRVSYFGNLEQDIVSLPPITVTEGYTQNVSFSLHGDLAQYFSLTSVGPTVSISLANSIPEQSIPTNGIIIFEIRASATQVVPAYATIILQVVRDDDDITPDQLLFNQTFYTGHYTEASGLVFEEVITLDQGYDDSVEFTLEGENSQWFSLVQSSTGTVTIVLETLIPAAVLANNQKLIFVIAAQRTGSAPARATIVIALRDEYTETTILGFDRVSYFGNLEQDIVSLPPITVTEGYTQNVSFSLHGDLAQYFSLTSVGPTVSISLANSIPEQSIPANGIIIFEIRASATQFVPAYATIILQVVRDDDDITPDQLLFNQTFYTGHYTEASGLVFEEVITLDQGYDDSVEFTLEGENSQWFSLVRSSTGTVTIVLETLIPAAVLANNQKLIFVIAAQRTGSAPTRATIVIALRDEYTETTILGFDRVSYFGNLEQDIVSLPPITVTEGYTQNVSFSLHGDLAQYFSLTSVGPTVSISLANSIPEQSIPTNGIIILEIRASATQVVPAYATIILQVVRDDDDLTADQLLFNQTFYTGHYTEASGLVFEEVITLDQGYDNSVEFTLEGENSQWFSLVRSSTGTVTIVLETLIPAAVLANNQKLIFVIAAQRTGSAPTRATIVIALRDEYTETTILGFDRVSYFGNLEQDIVSLPPITVTEGYTQNVSFSLHGDLAQYFSLTSVGPTVSISLANSIPEQSIPTNGIIIFEIRASATQVVPAYATIILQVVRDDDDITPDQLLFNQTFYTGHYTEASGLVFEEVITLDQGYDDSVEFTLEGENSQWFSLVQSSTGTVTIVLETLIPAAVLANNQKLIFVIAAQRTGSAPARATIVIALRDEYTETTILGFDRVSYFGNLEQDIVSLPPITVTEGYTQNVSFSLHGDLAQYFSLTSVGPTVSISLANSIPEQSIPTNGIIILEIRASATQVVPAYATIILQVVSDDDDITSDQLLFNQTFYTGHYTEASGLVFEEVITLDQGYGDSVEFILEGENSQWFSLVRSSTGTVTIVLETLIPAAVLANNQKLIFVIAAQRTGSAPARATIVIALRDEYTETTILGFDRVSYFGNLEQDIVSLPPITVTEGYTQNVSFSLHGDLAQYFSLTSVGPTVSISLANSIPEQSIPTNGIIILEIRASATQVVPAYATIILQVVSDDDDITSDQLLFNQTFYTGHYTEASGLVFEEVITLHLGYDDSVEFTLEGENSQWFSLVRSSTGTVTIVLETLIPAAVLANNQKLIFVIAAQRTGSAPARATIVIALRDEYTETTILGFDRVSYFGNLEQDIVSLPPITVTEGYKQNVSFSLHGDLAQYFSLTSVGPTVSISLANSIPEQSIPTNGIIIFEIRASATQVVPAYATIILQVVSDDDDITSDQLLFNQTFYTGHYTEASGLVFEEVITLDQGYDDSVEFTLEGENSQWFSLVQSSTGTVTIVLETLIPAAVLANNQKLIFVIAAQRTGSAPARATIVIALRDEYTETTILGFDRVSYFGNLEQDIVSLPPITVTEGYTQNVSFSLHGDLAQYFSLTSVGPTVSISLANSIPEQLIPTNGIIILEIRASATQVVPAYATILLQVVRDDDDITADQLLFNQTFYTGHYTEASGLIFEEIITLDQGYDDSVVFILEGENSQWFSLVLSSTGTVTIVLETLIPAAVLANNQKLIFVIAAQRTGSAPARATIVIALRDDSGSTGIFFEKILYEGIVQSGAVQHEDIIISGYTGTEIDIFGDQSSFFTAFISNGIVNVALSETTLPPEVTRAVLELHVSGARAALRLEVIHSEIIPELPTVTFDSPSYNIQVGIAQTGLIGRVHATADNGETVAYSLLLDNAHLLERLSINNEGELRLSAPSNSGVYQFQVVATTINTRATGTTEVHIIVETTTVCGDEDIVVPPLIVIDRDEEEPHLNLVVLNGTEFEGCRYSLTNRWPVNQTWLYVDETGLHTNAIDREHESIAFMALSQIQVELVLHCDSDAVTRSKRSTERLDWLGPYDYGTKNWIITDTILYNSRRSFVNLIVNDINDNSPIFNGKENEPIVVGYPVPELVETLMPRALAELQATDADIGENAALMYWSTEPELSVAPTTGFVHVRDGAVLNNDQILTIQATDRNGEGLTGSIDIMVKLLTINNVAVITVRDSFLDYEDDILRNISTAVGYEVKPLRSVVIFDENNENGENIRNKRDVNSASGASLQIYVYGLIEREPVHVDVLTEDIDNNEIVTVSIAGTISLEDYLKGREVIIVSGRDTGLLVATIVLSILLFILIVAFVVWFIFTWRKQRNYDQFSDENSLGSQDDSLNQIQKPESLTKPRLNIDELKRSERRLQEMLDAPFEEVSVQPTISGKESVEAIVNLSSPDSNLPIVIQSIDKLKDAVDESEDDDEFGERKTARRKSVVTFNENVEKIIHVEDIDPASQVEVYKF